MRPTMNRTLFAVVIGGLIPVAAFAADPRPATEIIKEYENTKDPTIDASKLKDQSYVRKYVEERKAAIEKRSALALELYKSHPSDPQATKLMLERWSNLTQRGIARTDQAIGEIE